MLKFAPPWIVVSIHLILLGQFATDGALLAQETKPDDIVGESLLPTGQRLTPAGEVLALAGRPNDLCLSNDGKFLFVKSHKNLQVVDTQTFTLRQELPLPGGASLTGILADNQGGVLVSNSKNQLHWFGLQKAIDKTASDPGIDPKGDADNQVAFELLKSFDLPADSFPCGLTFGSDKNTVYICLSKKNSVVELDLKSGEIKRTFLVGISPFGILFQPGSQTLLVSNLGGRLPQAGEKTAPSAGTETPVDERGIAKTGSVSVISLPQGQVEQQIDVGLHPTALLGLSDQRSLVTLSNDDSFSILGDGKVQATVIAKPQADLSFGSMPNAVCISQDHKWIFVALSGNNAVAVYPADSKWDSATTAEGFIPTAWFPDSLACDQQYLYIANLKGTGSRATVRDKEKSGNSHDHLGIVQRVPLKEVSGEQWTAWSQQVQQQAAVLPNRIAEFSEGEMPAAVPVPELLGAPSVFKHVIYVIKENRTYDQVFGDMPEGRGEPSLCTFGEKFTPNHHALAKRFGLLDNYYCNGVLSADGHSWATEGNVTPYLERAFGGFSRSYTFGDDPLTYSSSGFLWDHVLGAGLSFRNYGEMDYAKPPAGMDYQKIFAAFEKGEKIQFGQTIGVERLRRYSCRDYPGWGMMIPDVLRMKRFLAEFEKFKTQGDLPNLCIVYLPQDHLGGGVTSAAHMADNDLALGQLVQAVSHSQYWKDTLIVVNEDDPQNGFDHIDGHRSICLAISAYSKPGVNHSFYNQTSVLRTILHVLGLPPMNQQAARSPLMTECFGEQVNLEPYDVIEANFPLNQTAQATEKQGPLERQWRSILATVPIERTGMKTPQDEDNLNRFIWHESKGWSTPYPTEWVGFHGRGLKALGLEFSIDEDEVDD